MVRFDETMKQVFQHCKQMLDLPDTGVREINRLVEKAIFSNAACPSPLLKFYYQLCENLGLEFCNREMLTLDQNVFKMYVTKLLHAHEYHLKTTRKAAVRESLAFMQEQFASVRSML
jgi:hypothetical protein